jgi:hypothetical protein
MPLPIGGALRDGFGKRWATYESVANSMIA